MSIKIKYEKIAAFIFKHRIYAHYIRSIFFLSIEMFHQKPLRYRPPLAPLTIDAFHRFMLGSWTYTISPEIFTSRKVCEVPALKLRPLTVDIVPAFKNRKQQLCMLRSYLSRMKTAVCFFFHRIISYSFSIQKALEISDILPKLRKLSGSTVIIFDHIELLL